MKKISQYRNFFGGTWEQCYYDLIDSGDIRESEYILSQCKKLDRG